MTGNRYEPAGQLLAWWHDACDSTQQLARDWAASDRNPSQRAGAVVTGHQRQGLGRQGRQWIDRPGEALLLSVAVRKPDPSVDLDAVTVAAAEAVRAALTPWAGAAVSVKAPNDLVIDGRKLAGLLADARSVGNTVEWVIVGCGMNLRGPNFAVGEQPATTLEAACQIVLEPHQLVLPVAAAICGVLGYAASVVVWQPDGDSAAANQHARSVADKIDGQ